MMEQNLIRVIKRAERERLEQQAAGGANLELSAREKARELASTVKEWVSEFRQSSLEQRQEIKRQLGWPESVANGQGPLVERGSRKGQT